MKKLGILLTLLCLMGCLSVSAETICRTEAIDLGEVKVVTVPQPESEVDNTVVYFQQEFVFVPEESGTYWCRMYYEEDATKPYDVFMDISGSYMQLENGVEFEANAGESYAICFQYPNFDGRYPQITFWLTEAGTEGEPPAPETVPENNPQTADGQLLFAALPLMLAVSALMIIKKETL